MDRLYYVTRARIPTEKAHGLQIVKMCQAYSACGHDVTLVIPKRRNAITQSIEEYYKIDKAFTTRYIQTFVPIIGNKLMGPLLFWLEGLIFLGSVTRLSLPRNVLIITRSIEIAWWFQLLGKKVVFEVHDLPQSYSWIYRKMIKRLRCIVCTSQGIANGLERYGVTRVLVSSNAVDEAYLHPLDTLQMTRLSMQLPEDKKILMYIGSLQVWKGVTLLLEASTLLEPKYQVVIIGGGAAEVQKLQSRYPAVIFLGFVPHDIVPQYQQFADVLVSPNTAQVSVSALYTSPLKLFEYMSSKKPILVTDIPSIREIVSESEVYFFDGTAPSFITVVDEIFTHPIESGQRAQAAFDKVKNNTWRNRAKRILDFAEHKIK